MEIVQATTQTAATAATGVSRATIAMGLAAETAGMRVGDASVMGHTV